MRTKILTVRPGTALAALLATLLATLLAACATHSPVLDSRFGAAVLASRAQQTIEPLAGQKAGPVAGIDGNAAAAGMERYRASFKSPPEPVNVFNIGVGSAGGSR